MNERLWCKDQRFYRNSVSTRGCESGLGPAALNLGSYVDGGRGVREMHARMRSNMTQKLAVEPWGRD